MTMFSFQVVWGLEACFFTLVAGAGQTLGYLPDPFPNAPRDEVRRKEPLSQSVQFCNNMHTGLIMSSNDSKTQQFANAQHLAFECTSMALAIASD